MTMSNKTFDILSFVGKIVLPALAVLYRSLAGTWGLPFVDEIPTTIMAIDLFLNTCLGISSANYYKEIAETSTNVVDDGNYKDESTEVGEG